MVKKDYKKGITPRIYEVGLYSVYVGMCDRELSGSFQHLCYSHRHAGVSQNYESVCTPLQGSHIKLACSGTLILRKDLKS